MIMQEQIIRNFNKKQFGCQIEDLDDYIEHTGLMLNKEDAIGASIVAVNMLSDAQEMLERDQTELANQFINRAKYILMKNRRTLRLKENNNGYEI